MTRCVESALHQSVAPDEIVIADDGSGAETIEVINSFKNQGRAPIVHIWQPDQGYQLAQIRNKAFVAAGYEYLVQVDGDLILHPQFIRDHLAMSHEGTFVSGSRVNMDETLTEDIISGKIAFSEISNQTKHLQKKYNGWYSPLLCRLNHLLQRSAQNYKHVLGCNMAFWKKDLQRVNGYNEDFTGWGKEDNDLALRLMNSGVKLRFVKYGAIMYHLAHKVADLSSVPENEQLLEKSRVEKISFVRSGMSNHLGK